MPIGEPSRAEIPSRFGCRPNVTVKICRISETSSRGLDVLAIGLVARFSAVVPITIENRSVHQPNHAAIALATFYDRGSIHPIGIFRFQLWEIGHIGIVTVPFGDQVYHQRKKRRLRATEIVAAIPIWHVSVAVDLESKVLEHVEREIVAPICCQAQHGEIGIPIVELPESATRNDIRIWQRQKGPMSRHLAAL